MPEKQRIANPSSDSEPEDADGAVDTEDVGGADDVPPARAKAHKKSEHLWRVKDNHFGADLPPFLGEWKLNVSGSEAVDFFTHLFPEELVNDTNTNLYALQKGKGKLAVTKQEMMTFLGINMVMSYIRYPRMRMYWSSDAGLRFDLIANAMSVNRFGQILRYIHFVDNYSKKPGEADKLFKIRPVLESLKKSFHSAVDPEEFQSIDEQIIPFKGKLSIKQYIPKKPKPWGVKVWVRAGTSGYMYRFEVYQGAARRGEISQMGLAPDVIMRLCDDIKQKNHKVFFDNFFCTIPLLVALQQHGIYGTGTCRVNRLQGAEAKLKTEKQLKEEGRGACSVVTTAENITVTRWLDNKVIHMASSCVGRSPTDEAQRWCKKKKEMLKIQRPFSVKLYNQHMGGVDHIDQMVAMYPHRRTNKRWYIRVFFHFLDVTVVNAWHLERMSGLVKRDLLHFKSSLARSLINAGSFQIRFSYICHITDLTDVKVVGEILCCFVAGSIQIRKRGRPNEGSSTPFPPTKNLRGNAVSKTPPEIRFAPGNHWPRLTDGKNANRCKDAACTRKSKYVCMQCDVALCPGCFANFHTR